MKEFENLKMQNHWKFLFTKGLLIQIIGVGGFGIFIYFSTPEYERDWENIKIWVEFLALFLFIQIAPLLYLHYSYYQISKNVLAESSGVRIGSDFYKFEDAKQVWVNKPRDYRNPFSDYFYVKLVFSNRKEVFLTALLNEEIEGISVSKCNNAKVFYENGFFAGFPDW